MKDSNYRHFDMTVKPCACKWYLKPAIWALALPYTLAHSTKIKKTGMKGLKPPYVLLANHNAFYDMVVAMRASFPYIPHFVVAVDGFIGFEGVLRKIGCIGKRKFTNDLSLIRNLKYVIEKGGIAGIYPEARYSLCGTTAPLPESLGKLCKMFGVPVVTLISHGHHINHPFWNTRHDRFARPTEAEMKLLLTADDVKNLSADEINARLVKAFQYDDFKWQKEHKIKISRRDRAVGLEKILYQCPNCRTEFEMESSGTTIRCKACKKEWRMTEYGELEAINGETEFSHIPDWYEWERSNVKAEVLAGTYSTGVMPATVRSLPNPKDMVELGEGTLIHDMNGFRVSVKDEDGTLCTVEKTVPSLYSCHIEFEYKFKYGDSLDISTLNDSWFINPHDCGYSLTKMALATEELYYDYRRKIGKPCKDGLA